MRSSSISRKWREVTLPFVASSAPTARRPCRKRMSASRRTAESRSARIGRYRKQVIRLAARTRLSALTAQLSPCGSRRGLAHPPSTRPWRTRTRSARRSTVHPTIRRSEARSATGTHWDRSVRPATTRVALYPNLRDLGDVAHDAGAGGDREISSRLRIDEYKADIGHGLDLVLLCAVDVRHGKDQAHFAVGPGLDRSRPQSPGGLRRQHAYADLFDDVPDAVAVVLLAHVDGPCISAPTCATRELLCSRPGRPSTS